MSTFEFIGDDSDFDIADDDSAASEPVLPIFPVGKVQLGRYQPAAAAAAVHALHWVPYAAAVSAVRGLLGASHEDLRIRLQPLCRSLSGTFFLDDGAAAGKPLVPRSFAPCERYPEEKLFVCADRPPLAQALQAVNRAMMQVAVKDASHGPCDHYYDALGHLMWLLVDDKGAGRAVFDQTAFESVFQLEWVPE